MSYEPFDFTIGGSTGILVENPIAVGDDVVITFGSVVDSFIVNGNTISGGGAGHRIEFKMPTEGISLEKIQSSLYTNYGQNQVVISYIEFVVGKTAHVAGSLNFGNYTTLDLPQTEGQGVPVSFSAIRGGPTGGTGPGSYINSIKFLTLESSNRS